MTPYDDHARFTDSLFDENLQDEMLEFESEIDFLFNAIKEYRKSRKFRDIIEFCNRFNHIAPFNAMLINMQRPGSRLALTAKDKIRLLPALNIPMALVKEAADVIIEACKA